MIGPSSSSQSEIPNIKFEDEKPKIKFESTEIGNVTKCHRCVNIFLKIHFHEFFQFSKTKTIGLRFGF